MNLKDFNFGKFKKNYKKVESNKEGLENWIDKTLSELKKRGNLKLKDIANTEGRLYERCGWSREDDNGNIKIRLEVKGKTVYFSEEHAKSRQVIMCDNSYSDVLGIYKDLKKYVSGLDDDVDLWYIKKGKVEEL